MIQSRGLFETSYNSRKYNVCVLVSTVLDNDNMGICLCVYTVLSALCNICNYGVFVSKCYQTELCNTQQLQQFSCNGSFSTLFSFLQKTLHRIFCTTTVQRQGGRITSTGKHSCHPEPRGIIVQDKLQHPKSKDLNKWPMTDTDRLLESWVP